MAVGVALHCAYPVLQAGFEAAIVRHAATTLTLLNLGDIRDHHTWMEELRRAQPQVLLVDVQTFVPYGLLTELQEAAPETRIVLWAAQVCAQMARHAIELGVRGILSKESDLILTVRCLERVATGELWFERRLTDQLIGGASIRLSSREMQLLTLVTQGLSNKEIAHALDLTEGTIKQYFTRLFRKCAVNDRLELVFYGMRNLFGESVDGQWANSVWSGDQSPTTIGANRSTARYGLG